jgi:hypothetical protein
MKKQTAKKLLTPKIPRSLKPLSHVPALDNLQLEAALLRLQDVPISKDARNTLADILKAAANPDSERIDVVIKTLPPERRRNVDRTAARVSKVTKGVTARARAGLQDMSEEAWNRLVDEANDE